MPNVMPASSHASLYQDDVDRADQLILQTVACYAIVFAAARCHRLGIPWKRPSVNRTFYENLFTMAGMVDSTTGRPDPVKLHSFRRFSMLNADHGMALVVFSTLVTASSLTDPISCLISAITAAYGPLHFGATESAQNALSEIGDPTNVPAFLEQVKAGKRKLFGYGHREYKGVDPRVQPIRKILKDLTPESNPLFKIAEAIEVAAATDEYFVSRRLFPNADFYGNFVFTSMFVLPFHEQM
jgi:citrate synthase